MLFCLVTGAAPIAAMLFNLPAAVLGGGFAAPAAFLIATIVLTIFAVGYIEMARTVTAAGRFYSFVTHGFGPIVGMGTAALISLCYVIFTCAVIGVTGYFASTSINDWFSIDLPRVGLHDRDHRAPLRAGLVSHRGNVEDPWRVPGHGAHRAADLRLRDPVLRW